VYVVCILSVRPYQPTIITTALPQSGGQLAAVSHLPLPNTTNDGAAHSSQPSVSTTKGVTEYNK
jgi:hypothetical protein